MSTLKSNLEELQKIAQERTVKTQTIEYDLETLVKKIQKGIIKLNPEYQRRHRWSDEVSSRLIESLILNIPIPLIYISQDIDVDKETDEGISRYSVIDGQQRLTAIYNFFSNKYALCGLEVLDALNEALYKDLPPFLIRRLEERTIRCLRVDSTADRQVKYDIFERLNSGSIKLEPQELRNATSRGPFRDLIKVLAKNDLFLKLIQMSPDSRRLNKMEDEELVLRYFALTYNSGYKDYKKGFKEFLTNKMNDFNKLDNNELSYMNDNFLSTFTLISKSFGETPFAKYKPVKEILKLTSRFNTSVYDSIIVPFASLKDNPLITYDKFKEIFFDATYKDAIESNVTDASKLLTRIDLCLSRIK